MKIIIIVVIFTIIYVLGMDVANKYLNGLDYNTSQEEIFEEKTISVEIRGSISNPGTYVLDNESTLNELINKAGGLLNNSDKSAFNSFLILKEGGSYYIPYSYLDENNVNLKVSINTATSELLDTLPGIGLVYATRIVEYRQANGEFKAIEEIMNVTGIGNSIFNSLKDLICL